MDPELTALTQQGLTGLLVIAIAIVLRAAMKNGLAITVQLKDEQLKSIVTELQNLTKFEQRLERLEAHDRTHDADLSQQRAALSELHVRVDERTSRRRSTDRMPVVRPSTPEPTPSG